jgi:hypothetical protein
MLNGRSGWFSCCRYCLISYIVVSGDDQLLKFRKKKTFVYIANWYFLALRSFDNSLFLPFRTEAAFVTMLDSGFLFCVIQ